MGCCCGKKKKEAKKQKDKTDGSLLDSDILWPGGVYNSPQPALPAISPLAKGSVTPASAPNNLRKQSYATIPENPHSLLSPGKKDTPPPEFTSKTTSKTKPEKNSQESSKKSSRIKSFLSKGGSDSKKESSENGKSSISAKTPTTNEIESLCKATTFSGAEIKTWFRTFKQAYPKGKVGPEQFISELRKLYSDCDEDLFASFMFRAFDKNKDGTIDYREFITGLSMTTGDNVDDKLRLAFEIYDVNDNGEISKDEIFRVFTSLQKITSANPKHTPKQRAEKVFKVAKKGKGDTITLEEFIDVCKTDKLLRRELTALASYK